VDASNRRTLWASNDGAIASAPATRAAWRGDSSAGRHSSDSVRKSEKRQGCGHAKRDQATRRIGGGEGADRCLISWARSKIAPTTDTSERQPLPESRGQQAATWRDSRLAEDAEPSVPAPGPLSPFGLCQRYRISASTDQSVRIRRGQELTEQRPGRRRLYTARLTVARRSHNARGRQVMREPTPSVSYQFLEA